MIATGNWGCHYMEVKSDFDLGLGVSDRVGRFGLGLWQREDVFNQEEDFDCTAWTQTFNDLIVDSKWNAARSMASLAGKSRV